MRATATSVGPSLSRAKRRRKRRRTLAVAFVVMVVLGLVLGFSYLAATRARAHLVDGRAAVEAGQAELANGSPEGAGASFRKARADFARAASDARHPVLRLLGWMPLVGRTPDAITAIADAGIMVAQAGEELSVGIGALPGGMAALAPKGGSIRTSRFAALGPHVAKAERLVRSALSRMDGTAGSLLLGPVGDARAELLEKLIDTWPKLSAARKILAGLPTFLGENRPRKYFFGAQNPAELRGSGGFMGAYSILTIEKGRFQFTPFRSITSLSDVKADQIAPPNPDYARNYKQFGGAGFWENLNVTPDFPSAAVAVERLYQKTTGKRLDGVVAADPFVLRDLLKVTGPVRVPRLGIEVRHESVIPFTTNRSFAHFADSTTRKLVLGEVAKAVFERFMLGGGSPTESARSLVESIAGGHLMVYANDRRFEGGLVQAGAAGALPSPRGDVLVLVQNNGGGNKIDFFQRRSVIYSVGLKRDGTATGDLDVRLDNRAPDAGQPKEVIGPYNEKFRAGESVTILGLFRGPSSRLRGADRERAVGPLGFGREVGLRYFQDYIRIPSRRSAAHSYRFSVDPAWEGSNGGGTYRLTLVTQPTIRPTAVRVVVRVPQDTTIVETNIPMRVARNEAIWTGHPPRTLVLEVRFRPPLHLWIWRAVLRFLTKPAFRL